MPENVIIDNIISLPFDVDAWRGEIARVAKEGYDRRDRSGEVAKAGYSIREQIRQIERIYGGGMDEQSKGHTPVARYAPKVTNGIV
jgi:hypothetical protein